MSNDNVEYSDMDETVKKYTPKETVNKPKILKNIGKTPKETVVRSKKTTQPKIKTWNYD
tara:strand:+ start:444 stop:620 length:177 start_codon:yes stop_codon:yes gene_type:complete